MASNTFYMGYHRSRPTHIPPIASGEYDSIIGTDGTVSLVESDHEEIGILTNAQSRWSEAKEAFLHTWDYDTRRVMDSGGYNVQSSYQKENGDDAELDAPVDGTPLYPWSVEEYHGWLSENADGIEWAAVMDYACEERFDPMWSVEDRIEATIANTVEHFDHHGGEYELFPVLQGRCLEDYLDCYDRLAEVGIPVTKVGLGTVCRLSSSQEIVDLETRLRQRREFEHIHGFGVKNQAYRLGASFESADSQAWVWAASNGFEYRDDTTRLVRNQIDDSLRRTVISFREYYRYVSRLFYGEERLGPLEDHEPTDQSALSEFTGGVAE